ncbi:MAG: apolipoprotein N-acyltransferase [Verrucomicrobiales bacterium]|nr:apolipoprotein N-acyltransferase [Verrucomicrobiales bacterium]
MKPKTIWPWLAAPLSGGLLALCYPTWDINALIWFWALPLLAALWFSNPEQKKSGKPRSRAWRGWWIGYSSGLTFFLINLSWLAEVSGVGAVALPAYLAVYFGFFGAFAATIGRWNFAVVESAQANKWQKTFAPSWDVLRIAFLNGAMWCGMEWLRGVAFTGLPWNGLGVALHENLYLIQIADIIGVTGISFVMMFCSCVALATSYRLIQEFGNRGLRPHLDFTVAVAMVMGIFLYGLNRINQITHDPSETKDIRALLVQLNVPIDQVWDNAALTANLDDYYDLTTAYVETADFDLVVWPETALPGRFFYPWVQQFLNKVLAKGDFYLMAGLEEEVQPNELYNVATLMRGSTKNYQMYRKTHLVPFGEYLPLRNTFPPFEWVAGHLIPGDFQAGKSFEPLDLDDGEWQIIPLICFEDTIGSLARKFVRPGVPQVIVNVTNDGWFWESSESAQHLANARFRCIELRRPMIRAANTGVSCFIDEIGSLYDRNSKQSFERKIVDDASGSSFITGTLPGTVRMKKNSTLTIYARYGDWFSISLGCFAFAMIGLRWKNRRPRKPPSTN